MVENYVQLVFGRKPREIVTIENSSPEQLSAPVSSLEQMDQTLHKLAMKYYLEARQRAAEELLPLASSLPKDLSLRATVFIIGTSITVK